MSSSVDCEPPLRRILSPWRLLLTLARLMLPALPIAIGMSKTWILYDFIMANPGEFQKCSKIDRRCGWVCGWFDGFLDGSGWFNGNFGWIINQASSADLPANSGRLVLMRQPVCTILSLPSTALLGCGSNRDVGCALIPDSLDLCRAYLPICIENLWRKHAMRGISLPTSNPAALLVCFPERFRWNLLNR